MGSILFTAIGKLLDDLLIFSVAVNHVDFKVALSFFGDLLEGGDEIVGGGCEGIIDEDKVDIG